MRAQRFQVPKCHIVPSVFWEHIGAVSTTAAHEINGDDHDIILAFNYY